MGIFMVPLMALGSFVYQMSLLMGNNFESLQILSSRCGDVELGKCRW